MKAKLKQFQEAEKSEEFRRLMKLSVNDLDELLANLDFTELLKSKKDEKASVLLPLFHALESDIERIRAGKESAKTRNLSKRPLFFLHY